jgi:hypothetical protein
MINPAINRHPAEAAIIGRIVVAFGELEYMTVLCAGKAFNNLTAILKSLYRVRSTSSRIEAADALMRRVYHEAGLGGAYGVAYGAVKYCLRIRNQYAHCNWADGPMEDGLYFLDLQESAELPLDYFHDWKHVDAALLETQEAYFEYAFSWLTYLENELIKRRGKKLFVHSPKPRALAPPPLHNPQDQHLPEWLDEGQKAQHVARALAAKESVRSRERKPKPPKPKKLSARQTRDAKQKAARK